MKFRKIKWNGEEVKLVWLTELAKGSIEHTLTSFDKPEAQFEAGMAAFIPQVIKLLALEDTYGKDLRVTGLSINYEEESGREGLVITCLKSLPDFMAPLVINTPHMKEQDPEDANSSQMPNAVQALLEEMQRLAMRYVKGHREQGDLFAGGDDGDAQPESGVDSVTFTTASGSVTIGKDDISVRRRGKKPITV